MQFIARRVRTLPLVIGCLGLAGMLSQGWRDVLSVWGVIGTATIPVAIHLMIDSEFFSWRVARYSRAFGAIWFLIAAAIVLVSYPWGTVAAAKPWILPAFTLIGAVPSVHALFETLRPAPVTTSLELKGIVDGVAFFGDPGAPMLDFENMRAFNDTEDEQGNAASACDE